MILRVPVTFVPVVPAPGEVEIGYGDLPSPSHRQKDPDQPARSVEPVPESRLNDDFLKQVSPIT